MRKFGRGRVALCAVALTAAVSLVGATSASAAQDYIDGGTRIRNAANTSATVLGLGYPGQGVINGCYTSGGSYTYNNSVYGSGSSTLWELHTNGTTGVRGYSGYYLITGGVAHC